MISALASESLTSSGRSRSKRSVGRLSKSLTNACNSVNVFASIAFITIDDVGTFSFLASAMSIISPAYFSVGRHSDSNIRAAAHPIITAGRTAVRSGDRAVPIGADPRQLNTVGVRKAQTSTDGQRPTGVSAHQLGDVDLQNLCSNLGERALHQLLEVPRRGPTISETLVEFLSQE